MSQMRGTSDMVSVGEILRPPPAISTAQAPIFATSQLGPTQAFPIGKWRPRSGLDANYPHWKAGVRRLLAAYNVTEGELFSAMNTCRDLLSGAVSISYTDERVALKEAECLDKAISAWQAINTAVFWHVLASVDLVSSYSPTDMRVIERLYNKQLADGVELLRYLNRFADTTSSRVQRQLKLSVGGGTLLPAPVTRAKLHHHAELLFQRWQLIKGNDPEVLSSLADYWHELQESLPTGPACTAAELALASWLAKQVVVPQGRQPSVSAYPRLFQTFDSGLEALVDEAATLGLPAGTPVDRPALVFLGPDGQLVLDQCGGCDDDDTSGLNAIGGGGARFSGPPPGASVNKCKFCSSFYCQADDKGGAQHCICRWDSKDSLESCSRGGKRFVIMARRWHEANKSAPTLKGVRFTVRRADDGTNQEGCSCLLYTSPSPRDKRQSRMPSSA